MEQDELVKLKTSLAPQVLAVSGVSGIGVGAEGLNVYLEADNPDIRSSVEDIVRKVHPAVPIHFVFSGPFRA